MIRGKLTAKDHLLQGLNLFILILFTLVCFYPLYFVFINAFSSGSAIARGVYLWPEEFTAVYFQSLLLYPNLLNAIFISVMRTVIGTALSVLASTFVAYMVTRKDLPCRRGIYRYIVITMYLSAGLIPWYILMKSIGLKNNFLLYILPGMISAYNIVLVKTYIESIPPALEESAEIDGAGVLTIFFKLIIPLSLPVIACIAVFGAVGQWNAWTDNFYLVSNPKLDTLQYLLYKCMQSHMTNVQSSFQQHDLAASTRNQITATGLQDAMTVVTVLPILVVYPFMQKYFVKGIMLGAVKG